MKLYYLKQNTHTQQSEWENTYVRHQYGESRL